MEKVNLKTKLNYASGGFGKDLVYGFVATYMMYYFTDVVGISALFLGYLFFFTRAWDAINDPMMGLVVDNTRSRFGKFRPWILIGTLINALILIFLFYNPSLEGVNLYIYISIFYVLWGMSYTIMDIPYWSLIPALTKDSREREKIAVFPRVFASFGFFIASAATLKLVEYFGEWFNKETLQNSFVTKLSIFNQNAESRGFFVLAIVIAIVFILTILLTVFHVKEEQIEQHTKVKIKDVFKILLKNDQLRVVTLTMIFFNTVIYITTGLGIYYFKYNLDNKALFATFVIIAGVSQVISLIIFPILTQVITRKTIFKISVFLPLVGYAILFITSRLLDANTIVILGSGVILFIGLGFSQILSTVMLADTVEYGEWKLEKRNESLVFSMQPFIVKIASAISGLVIGLGLSVLGFIPNAIQAPSTLRGIEMMMFILPAIGLFISMFIYLRYYKIDQHFYAKITKEISEREQ